MQHEKFFTSWPVGAMPSLYLQEYLQIKLTGVSAWLKPVYTLPFALASIIFAITQDQLVVPKM